MDSANIEIDQVMTDKDIQVRKVTSDRNIKRRKMLYRTVCHGLVIFTIGMTLAMRGPSFMDLQLISGVDVERGSFFYTASAFGYIIGAFFTGVIYTRVKWKDMLIIGPIIVIFFSATPWCTDFMLMMGVHAAMSFFGAITETTVNTEEVKRWEGNSYTAMQFLSFAYSLGGIIGPLIVESFLAPKALVTTSNLSTINHTMHSHSLLAQDDRESANISHYLHNKNNLLFTAATYLHKQGHQNESEEELNSDNHLNLELGHFHNSSVESNLSQTLGLQTNIHYAYFIAGVIIILCALPLCVLHIWAWRFQQKQVLEKTPKEDEKRLPLKMYIILTGLLSMFYFFYTTIDDPYSMYLPIFVVSHLDWSKEDGAIVSSLYWGCSTATKLAMVFLVHYINPSLLMFCSCLGMVIFMTVLSICAYFHVHFMIWLCTALMALSQSGLFGGGFAWADTYLLKVDDKVTSCTMIFSSMGAMLAPMLLGVMMKELSPMAFPCLLIFQAFVTLAIFLIMLLVFKPYVSRMYGPPRAEHQEIKVVEENHNLFQEDTE